MTAVGLAVGEPSDLNAAAVPAEGWVALAYLVLVGSILGYTAYIFALGNAPLSVVGTYAMSTRLSRSCSGALILDEPVTAVVLGGGLLVVGGVALVLRGERAPAAVAESDPHVAEPVRAG